jgi:hypothetical protein
MRDFPLHIFFSQSRLMNQPAMSGSQLYTGVLDCLSKTIRMEGWSALYKGFVPNYMRLGPWNVVVWQDGFA